MIRTGVICYGHWDRPSQASCLPAPPSIAHVADSVLHLEEHGHRLPELPRVARPYLPQPALGQHSLFLLCLPEWNLEEFNAYIIALLPPDPTLTTTK